MLASLRSYLAEPAVPHPPARNGRDLALVAVVSLAAAAEAIFRTDAVWAGLPIGWRIAAVVVFAVSIPPALLLRRSRQLMATLIGFVPNLALGVAIAAAEGVFGGLNTTAVVLIVPYALYRWGSGRDGARGGIVLLAALIAGNASDPSSRGGEWIGGFVVLALPVLLGLAVRYRTTAQERAVGEIRSREREHLARELHDSVAHHVSAIAIQARAGQAVGATDPQQALDVLAVIEAAASRTLAEMRSIVVALRDDDGDAADLSPTRGLADLAQLAQHLPSGLDVLVDVTVDPVAVEPAIGTAIHRIARESVTNAVRHARGARTVRVAVTGDDDVIRLTVRDDGNAAIATNGEGYGIRGMTERATLVGGRLAAGPAPGGGWLVTAELPMTADAGGVRS